MTTNFNALCELPFHNLHHQELIRATGAWVHHTPISLLNSKDLFQDTIESPEKNDYRIVLTKITQSQNTTLPNNQGLFQKAKRLKIYHYWGTLLPQLRKPLKSLPSLK